MSEAKTTGDCWYMEIVCGEHLASTLRHVEDRLKTMRENFAKAHNLELTDVMIVHNGVRNVWPDATVLTYTITQDDKK